MDSRTSCEKRLMSVSLMGDVVILPSSPTFCQSSSTTPTLRRFKLPTGCFTYESVRSTSKLRVLCCALELGPLLAAVVCAAPGAPAAGAGFPGVAAPGIVGAPDVPGG